MAAPEQEAHPYYELLPTYVTPQSIEIERSEWLVSIQVRTRRPSDS